MKAPNRLLPAALLCFTLAVSWKGYAQFMWTPKADLPGLARYAGFSFSIGNKGYLGTGHIYSSGTYLNDFWEYDPAVDAWTQKADFGGGARAFTVGFAIGNYGYAGTGASTWNNSKNDFWKYDPGTNVWTPIANAGNFTRKQGFGFSIGNKGYIGTGWDGTSMYNDLLEYDPASNTWSSKANFPGGYMRDIDRAVFVLGTTAYMNRGFNGSSEYNEIWAYNQATNSWSQKANVPGMTRRGAVGFSICGYGFLGFGLHEFTPLIDLYRYYPSTNTWSAAPAFNGPGWWDQQVFVINNRAYLGTGNTVDWMTGEPSPLNDLWEFAEAPLIATVTPSQTACAGSTLTLIASGGTMYYWSSGNTNDSIVVSPSGTTVYTVTVFSGECYNQTLTTTVTVVDTVNAAYSLSYDPCLHNCVQFSDVSLGAFTWDWNFGDGNYSVLQSPCHAYADSALYPFQLVINSGTVCADTVNGQVLYQAYDTSAWVFIPDAFSPNGDGVNDKLYFRKADTYCLQDFEISIYDRWGEMIFRTTDITDSWDGMYKGDDLNTDVVVYYCRASTRTGITFQKKGDITIIR